MDDNEQSKRQISEEEFQDQLKAFQKEGPTMPFDQKVLTFSQLVDAHSKLTKPYVPKSPPETTSTSKNDSVKQSDKVERLADFPFPDFAAYKKAVAGGEVKAAIDKVMAVQWTRNGIYAPPGLRTGVMLLLSLVPISVLAFIVYAIAARQWMLFLALPIMWVGLSTLILPGYAGVIVLLFLGLVWGIAHQLGWLIVLALPPLIVWGTNELVCRLSVAKLAGLLEVHEDLFCLFWSVGGIQVTLANGDRYCSEFKVESGKFVSHKKPV